MLPRYDISTFSIMEISLSGHKHEIEYNKRGVTNVEYM